MFSKPTDIEQSEGEVDWPGLKEQDLYLKNLAEYKKMLELLSVNKQLTDLLKSEDLAH